MSEKKPLPPHPQRIWHHVLPDSMGWVESYWSDSPIPDAAGGKVMEYLSLVEATALAGSGEGRA